MPTSLDFSKLTISEIAYRVAQDWKPVYFGAKPYLDAMYSLQTVDSPYLAETGRDIVPYFLSNANTWRGPVARAVKAELKKRLAKKS